MKQFLYFFALLFLLASCGSSQAVATNDDMPSDTETLEQKNRVVLGLLQRIRQKPGIIVRGGVPVFTKMQTDLSGARPIEPLYILDGYIVGNSFRAVNGLVAAVDVEKIEIFTAGPETAFYGSRGGGGVIKITTYQ